MKRILGIAVVLVVGLVMFAPTSEAKFYLGASATQTSLAFEEAGLDFDEDDTGWKGFVGFNFIKYFGLEAGYYDMGTMPISALSLEVDPQAAALYARGILPLGKHFELSAKLGYMAWDAEYSDGDSDSGADLTYGLGAAVIIGSHFEIRAEYEILDLGVEGVDSADLDIISLGAAFRF